MNNRYVLRIGHPILRPGLTIETESSERYVTAVARTLLDKAREINRNEAEALTPPRVPDVPAKVLCHRCLSPMEWHRQDQVTGTWDCHICGPTTAIGEREA